MARNASQNTAEIAIVARVLDAMLETIKAVGTDGAPAGVLYAALMAHGITLDVYTRMESLLLEQKIIYKFGHVLYHRDSVPENLL